MMMMMTMTSTFLMKQLRPQMIVTTMSLDPNIQILPLVIFLGHKSQGFHNHMHLAFYKYLHISWTLYANPHGGINIYSSNCIFFGNKIVTIWFGTIFRNCVFHINQFHFHNSNSKILIPRAL
jgi:hypothetical protein